MQGMAKEMQQGRFRCMQGFDRNVTLASMLRDADILEVELQAATLNPKP